MIFRPTQRLNKKIKWGALADAPLDENIYADWSTRLFTADRTQYILLSHTTSLYSVVMYGRGITDDNEFIQCALREIRDALEDDGLALIYANFIGPASAEIRFCKAYSRSVTGSMNDLEFHAKYLLENGEIAPSEVGHQLNNMPCSPIAIPGNDLEMPRNAFRQLKVK